MTRLPIFTLCLLCCATLSLNAQTIFNSSTASATAVAAEEILLPNITAPAGADRLLVVTFATTNLHGADFDSPNEMSGDYPTVTYNGMTLTPAGAAKRQGMSFAVMMYTLGLGTGAAQTGTVDVDYTGYPGTLFVNTVVMEGAASQNITTSGVGNGASNLGPSIFVGQTQPTLVYAAGISIGVPPQEGEVDQTRLFSQVQSGVSLATDYERSYTPKADDWLRFRNPNMEFRQFAAINIKIACATACSAPLPVELVSFEASAEAAHNLLRWQVENEFDLQHYTLQRAHAADADWTSVKTLPATKSTFYSVTDATPLPLSYYRLQSVNLDGSVQYSHVQVVQRPNTAQQKLRVYPNPASARVNLTFPALTRAAELQVIDMLGRRVHQMSVPASTSRLEIPASAFPHAGSYLLRLEGGRTARVEIIR